MSKGVAFGADSGTVALALATGEASMPIPESVKFQRRNGYLYGFP
jgi:aconitase B